MLRGAVGRLPIAVGRAEGVADGIPVLRRELPRLQVQQRTQVVDQDFDALYFA
jgi:hypothetical protein